MTSISITFALLCIAGALASQPPPSRNAWLCDAAKKVRDEEFVPSTPDEHFEANLRKVLAQLEDEAAREQQLADTVYESPPPPFAEVIPGLRYTNDFVSEAEAAQLCTAIAAFPEDEWATLTHRRLLNLGGVPHPQGSWSEPLPPFLCALLRKLRALDPSLRFDQCLLNEYRGGAGIEPHADGPLFDPLVAVVSLESDALLRFEPLPAASGSSEERSGFSVVLLKAGSEGHFTILKYFNEVMSFPLKVLVVFGSSKTELGPVTWLRGKPAKAEVNMKRPADLAAAAASDATGGDLSRQVSEAAMASPRHEEFTHGVRSGLVHALAASPLERLPSRQASVSSSASVASSTTPSTTPRATKKSLRIT